MRYLKFLLTLWIIFINFMPSYAYKYSEQDKDMFYSAFLEGYFTEMEKAVEKLDVPQEKKDKFMLELKRKTNKQELVNSSWSCIEKYPINQIVSASVICTSDWTNRQTEKTKDLFDYLK